MYEYKPLSRERKEIRLLTLEPGFANDTLFCKISTAFIDTPTPPHYETISYVCGDQTIKAKINLHGSESQVPATSEAALRCMRLPDKARTLWIDAICINEADVDERGHQVGMMYEVYTQTSHNLIYLGSDDGNMPKVIKSMEAILHELLIETRDYVDFETMMFETSGLNKFTDAPFTIDIRECGLIEFFQNPWFSRLWVVQEASLSRISTCYADQFRFPLTNVLRVAKWIQYKSYQVPRITDAEAKSIRNAVAIFDATDRTHGRCHRRPNSLWNFLYGFAGFYTFNRRDQVFALIALWQMHTQTAVLPPTLKPDYTLSVSEVFSNASKFTILEGGHLFLLSDVCASPLGKEFDFPSWIPVLDRSFVNGEDRPQPLNRHFDADHQSPVRFFDSVIGSKTLNVLGLLIDEVVGVTCTPTRLMTSDFYAFMEDAEDLCSNSNWVIDLGGDVETRAGLVLQAGNAHDHKRATDQEALQGYRSLKGYLEDHDSFPPWISDLGPSASYRDKAAVHYHEALQFAVKHRAVLHTKDGHLGLGPECTQPGDVLAILYGCPCPVVMRPLPKPGEYTFLECAYVYGIMDGEAVLKHRDIGREDDRFCIV